MPERPAGRLVILSGPSCAGKSPLVRALARLHPDLASRLQPVVLFNSRSPRPGERDGADYHFRPREHIDGLRGNDRYVVMDVRGDLQALDLETLAGILERGDALFEGNPFVGAALLDHPRLAGVPRLSLFMSPLSRAEILELREKPGMELRALVTDVMRRKLLRRTRRQKGELSLRDLENVEKRAGSAYGELGFACRFDGVLPNHDGEDSENWDAFYWPLGDARRALAAFEAVLRGDGAPGKTPVDGTERWERDLLPA